LGNPSDFAHGNLLRIDNKRNEFLYITNPLKLLNNTIVLVIFSENSLNLRSVCLYWRLETARQHELEDDGVDFHERMNEIHPELEQLNQEAKVLMSEIQKAWKTI
jgi:hypothetical protein